MRGRYYNVKIQSPIDGTIDNLKLVLWNYDEFEGFKQRMMNAAGGTDSINQFIIDAVTSYGFISPIVGSDVIRDALSEHLLKANERWVQNVFFGFSGGVNNNYNKCVIVSENNKTISFNSAGFSSSYPKAIFVNEDFTKGYRGGLGYFVGSAPITVTDPDTGRNWQAGFDFQNESFNPTSLKNFLNGSTPIEVDSSQPIPPDPDPPEGNIDTGTTLPGGYDPDSDEIPWDVPNWLSASDLGMCTVYNPTVAQVKSLATRLYSKDFYSGFENYLWGNPIESIIGLSVFPCTIPNGGTATVKSWGLDTGVTMTLAATTLVHVSCGALPVPSVYEGYLDYSPYTQAEVYIPYVGFVGLDVDDIMGQNLQLHYYIDIISGSATCKLVISNTSTTTVLGQWSCQVGRQIPIGSKDYNDIINAGVQLVASTISAYNGSVIPEIVTDYGDALEYEGGGFNGSKFLTQFLRAGSSAIMQAKPNITGGSAIASAAGQLAVQYPYLILKRPVSAKTNGYGALVGYPTFKYGNIGAYTGFVRCHNIKLDNIGCTDWELSEIFRLCCEGVYI